ncbi:TfoX/Sxy family protein [Microvirga sp. CF3016]|uniref:TfoX/Sxy family protein n=1 Tax=Microvirga sp. CF3016 TaxID=3110181 RepID=UPI002E77372E|nr:TfoX/Sxy family protein [Microvirga sp. CF3016]MEE1611981.1 TfoX/Sxy family protein [Microvirga sp. CF3016]
MDAEDLRDIFRSLGPIHIRRMFGGQGVYQGEIMFALVASDELYLKVDDESVGLFRDQGSRPFSFQTRDGRTTLTSYWLMPESALDDPDEAAGLGKMALAAAQRAKAAQVRKGRSTDPGRRPRKRPSEPAT